MVTQIMLRTQEEKKIFLDKKYPIFDLFKAYFPSIVRSMFWVSILYKYHDLPGIFLRVDSP